MLLGQYLFIIIIILFSNINLVLSEYSLSIIYSRMFSFLFLLNYIFASDIRYNRVIA